MKKGDRVIVKIHAQKTWYGVITGEGGNGQWWNVRKDGVKNSRGIHKSFCREIEHAEGAGRSDHRAR